MFTVCWLKQPQCQLKIVSKQQGTSVYLDKIKPFPKRQQLKSIYVKVMNVTKWPLSLKKLYILYTMNLWTLYRICIFLSSFLEIVSKTVDFITIKKKCLLFKTPFYSHILHVAFNGCETEYLNVILILKSRSILETLQWCNVTGLMCKVHTGQTQNNLSLIITVFYSTPTRQLDAIRIMEWRTYLFCCRGSPTLEDEYLSAVSSDPLRGGKQIPAIYLIPPEIMSQQAQGTQSFIGAHRLHGKINK